MQAITTRYFGPTNSRGGRVQAKAAAGKIMVDWDHSLGVLGNHKAAAETFARKLKWPGEYVGGGMPNEEGYVFVNVANHDDSFKIGREEVWSASDL